MNQYIGKYPPNWQLLVSRYQIAWTFRKLVHIGTFNSLILAYSVQCTLANEITPLHACMLAKIEGGKGPSLHLDPCCILILVASWSSLHLDPRGWAKRENESSGYFNKFFNPSWFLNTLRAKLSLFCKHSFLDGSYLLLSCRQVTFQNI